MDNSNDLNGVVQTIKELEDARNQYMCENEVLSEQMAELESEVEEMENIHQEDLQTIEDQEAQMQNLQKENKTLQCAIQAKDAEIGELKSVAQELEDLKRENEGIAKDIEYCDSQAGKLKESIKKIEEVIEEKKQNITRLEHQINRVQTKMNEYRKAMEHLADENECIQRRNEECKKSLDEATGESKRLLQQIEMAESARQKLEDNNKRSLGCIKQLKLDLAKEQGIGTKLQNKIQDLEEENNKMKKEIQKLREEIEALNEELDEEQAEIDKCRCELKRKIQEFENYKNTITSLRDKIMNNRNTCNSVPLVPARSQVSRRSRYGQKSDACASIETIYRSKGKEKSPKGKCSVNINKNTGDCAMKHDLRNKGRGGEKAKDCTRNASQKHGKKCC